MKFLLATHHLSNWSGSELVTLEFAEELLARGHSVDLFSVHHSASVIEEWQVTSSAIVDRSWHQEEPSDIGRARGLEFSQNYVSYENAPRFLFDAMGVPQLDFYDLVYAHHGMLTRLLARQPHEVIFGARRPAFVYNHLSPYEYFERPGALSEVLTADLVLANSPETAAVVRSFGSLLASAEVMPNPAPRLFETARRSRRSGPAARILVVSNHLPSELGEAVKIMTERGVKIDRVGLPANHRRLTPSDLREVDGVVTIGKTVQYALRAGCPVYIYDQFKGPGWLTADNFERAERVNFSGRDEPNTKSPEEIASEVMFVPQDAIAVVSDCPPRFHLELWVERLLALARTSRRPMSLAMSMEELVGQLFKCEENTSLNLDRMYDAADRYREAYQKCSGFAEDVVAERDRLQRAYNRELRHRQEAEANAERYHIAYDTERARSAERLSDAERFHAAYNDESARTAELLTELERLHRTLEAEKSHVKAMSADVERYRLAFEAERGRNAQLLEQLIK